MMHPTREGSIFVAEKTTFQCLLDFLQVEFYRGLAMGNTPRRCHNCGKYFLLTAGYNTCYCNNIAPGETDRTYNRLKQRKNRKKISVDEWNTAVVRAQKLLDQSERGQLTDEELRRKLRDL